jgi:hypothetical protein
MATGQTYVPIATTTLGSAAASYTFSSIPATFTDLILITNIGSTTGYGFTLRVGNGTADSGTNYSTTRLYGNGTAATSDRQTAQTGFPQGWNVAQNTLIISNIFNYANTTTYKTALTRISDAGQYTAEIVGTWRSTVAVDVVSAVSSTTFPTGTTFTLYGIAAA